MDQLGCAIMLNPTSHLLDADDYLKEVVALACQLEYTTPDPPELDGCQVFSIYSTWRRTQML